MTGISIEPIIYIAIFVIAFLAVRLVTMQIAKARDFTSLKTVTFGDESAVRPNRAASIISVGSSTACAGLKTPSLMP